MDNINDIISSLSQDDISSLKAMAESIFGDGGSDSPKSSHSPESSNGGFSISPDMIFKISSVMNAMNSSTGEKYRLIEALKPNLSEKRQRKADEAMQIIKLLEIMPLISGLNLNGDNNGKL